jgi:hypothetical protein
MPQVHTGESVDGEKKLADELARVVLDSSFEATR